jgi:hypothetical protein
VVFQLAESSVQLVQQPLALLELFDGQPVGQRDAR